MSVFQDASWSERRRDDEEDERRRRRAKRMLDDDDDDDDDAADGVEDRSRFTIDEIDDLLRFGYTERELRDWTRAERVFVRSQIEGVRVRRRHGGAKALLDEQIAAGRENGWIREPSGKKWEREVETTPKTLTETILQNLLAVNNHQLTERILRFRNTDMSMLALTKWIETSGILHTAIPDAHGKTTAIRDHPQLDDVNFVGWKPDDPKKVIISVKTSIEPAFWLRVALDPYVLIKQAPWDDSERARQRDINPKDIASSFAINTAIKHKEEFGYITHGYTMSLADRHKLKNHTADSLSLHIWGQGTKFARSMYDIKLSFTMTAFEDWKKFNDGDLKEMERERAARETRFVETNQRPRETENERSFGKRERK